MTRDRKADSENIIYAGIGAAVAAAVIPIPVADAVAISGVQVSMLYGVARQFDLDIKRKRPEGIGIVSCRVRCRNLGLVFS
jgi:uncharacterized protein (DUF697 family)